MTKKGVFGERVGGRDRNAGLALGNGQIGEGVGGRGRDAG